MSGRIRHHVVIADEAALSVLCGLKRAERSAAEGQDFADLACMLPSLPHVRLWLSAKLPLRRLLHVLLWLGINRLVETVWLGLDRKVGICTIEAAPGPITPWALQIFLPGHWGPFFKLEAERAPLFLMPALLNPIESKKLRKGLLAAASSEGFQDSPDDRFRYGLRHHPSLLRPLPHREACSRARVLSVR